MIKNSGSYSKIANKIDKDKEVNHNENNDIGNKLANESNNGSKDSKESYSSNIFATSLVNSN